MTWCLRCKRRLSDPVSERAKLGPSCRKALGVKLAGKGHATRAPPEEPPDEQLGLFDESRS